MNCRISILLIAFFFVQTSLFADRPGNPAKVDKDCKAYMDERFVKIKSDIEDLKAKQETLEKRIAKLEKQAGDSVSESKTSKGHYPWEIWLAIIVLGIFTVFKINGKTPNTPSVLPMHPATNSGRPRCPRCGQEHDPGDTICKNPNCKTQF